MTRKIIAVLFIFLLAQEEKLITLNEGEQITLKEKNITRVAVGDPARADVRVLSENELLITGKAVGETSLILWSARGKKEFKLRITHPKGLEEIKELLKEMKLAQKVRAREVKEKIVITGMLDTLKEEKMLKKILKLFPAVVSLVEINLSAYRKIAAEIQQELKKEGYAHVRVWNVGKTVFVEGEVSDEHSLKKALTIARAIYEGVVWVGD